MSTQTDPQQAAMLYFQLLQQGVPAPQAFQQAYPNGLPKKPGPQDLAKDQQKQAIGAIGGTLAGTLGTYYLIDALSGSGTAATGAAAAGAGAAGTAGAGGAAATGGTLAASPGALASAPSASLVAPEVGAVAPGLASGAGGGGAAIGATGATSAGLGAGAAPTGLLTGASPAMYFGVPAAFLGGMSIAAPSIAKTGSKLAASLGIGDNKPERIYNPDVQAISKNLNLQLPGLTGIEPDTRKAILDKFMASGALRLPGTLGDDEQKLELSTEGSSLLMPKLRDQDREMLDKKYGKWNRALPVDDMVNIMSGPGYKQDNPRISAFKDAYNMFKSAQGGMQPASSPSSNSMASVLPLQKPQPLPLGASQPSGSGTFTPIPRAPTGNVDLNAINSVFNNLGVNNPMLMGPKSQGRGPASSQLNKAQLDQLRKFGLQLTGALNQ